MIADAAVSRWGSKRSPLVVSRPANRRPYQDAITSWTAGVRRGESELIDGIGDAVTGADATRAEVTVPETIANGTLRITS
jgi:hypothetical protein